MVSKSHLKLLLLVILVSNNLLGQKNPYFFSHQIDSILLVDSSNFKFQMASLNYSLVGDYKSALEVKDRQFPNAKPSKPSQEQIDLFKRYKPIDAKQEIINEAAKRKIIIINEAHHIGLHRNFVMGLLKDLKKLGYTHIGFEALNYEDKEINERKYPTIATGVYTSEPCFGNLIREAIENKIAVFPYEQLFLDSEQVKMGREKSQAINIKKMMDKNPDAKFIIYCGYDHAVEDTLKNFMGLPMAGQLKQMTSIDPFTIDQTNLTEYYIVGNKYRKLINEKYSALFMDSASNYFNRASFPKKIDCNLFHPNTTFIYNRPSWLINKKMKFILLQEKIKIEYPYLIKVYLENEDLNNAVPIDIIEIKSASEQTASLIYKNKKQMAVVENAKGERQMIQIGKKGKLQRVL